MTALRRIGIVLIVLMVLASVAVWFLPTLAGVALRHAAGDDFSFEQLSIGLRQARIEQLAFGGSKAQRVDAIQIEYAPGRLVHGEIEQLSIEGLDLHAVLDDDGLRLQGMDPTAKEDDIALPSALAPKSVVIMDSAVEVETPFGLMTLPFAGRIETRDDHLHFEAESRSAKLGPGDKKASDADPDTEVTLRNGTIQADISISGDWPLSDTPALHQLIASGTMDVALADATISTVAREINGEGRIQLDLAHGKFVARSASFALSGKDPSLAGKDLSLADNGPGSLWEATLGRTDAPIELKGEPLDGGWHLTFDGPATLKSGRGSFASKLGATVAIDEHNRLGRIERADLAVDLADVAMEDVTLEEGRIDLSVEGTPSSLDGNLTLALDGFSWRTPGLRVQDVRAQRTFDLTLRDHLLSLVPATDGEKVSIGKFAIGDELETGWFTSPWPASDQPWLQIDLDRGRFDHRFEGVIDPVRIDIGSNRIWARIEDLTTSFTGTLSSMEKGRVLIKQGRIDMPAADLALVGIESDIPFNHDGLVGDQTIPLTIRLLRPLDQPYWFVPVRLDTEVRSTENEVSFSGQARTKTRPAVPVDLAGNHDLIHGRGSLDINHAPFAFAVGGLQPADLIPSLDGVLEDVAGSLALDGRIGWNDGDLSGNLALLIEELGFAIGPARLERINGVIQFDDVEPLSTPPDQLLSIALLDVGIPLTDGLVEMQLRRDGQLAVDQLAWRLADGKVRADPFTFGSDVQDLTMVLKADALDLNALLGLTALDGLSGEGRINGAVPLTISEAAAAISKGEFAAAAPGILRYRPDQAPGVLQAGGESVRLMLQALENFHYDALRITLDGQTDGATDIGLHLKGANPELYDGHPLEFNFNLEGNLASLIQTNLDNYQIPDRVSERLQGFGR